MTQLDTILQSSKGAVISAIAGMGGIGKTQLAAKYTIDYQHNYPGGICWFNGRTDDLAAQIALKAELDLHLKGLDAAKEQLVQPNAIAQWCWRHWQPETGRVLVVLDDVIDWAQCRACMPTGDRFCILVTTRQQNLLPHYETISLNVLQPQEARLLLASLEKWGRVAQDQTTADQLCAALGYLPLAIELVGCYLATDPYLTLVGTTASLQNKGMQDPMLGRPKSYEIVAQRGVRAAFELTWETIEPEAQQIARLLSYFALNWIEWELAESVMQAVEGKDYAFGGWKARLVNASLVEIKPEQPQWCRLHPLIQQFLREEEVIVVQEANSAPLRDAFTSRMVVFAQQIPDSATTRDLEVFEGIRPHIQNIIEYFTVGLDGVSLRWLFAALARFYMGQGLYAQAEAWCEQCLSMIQVRFEDNHFEVAISLNNLAFLYIKRGRLEEAENLYLQALEMYQRLFQGDHLSVADGLNNLGGLYNEQERLEEAENLYLQALEMYQRLFQGDHFHMALGFNNLAFVYSKQGRLEEAENFYLQALEMYQHLFQGDYPNVATSLNNLALLYIKQRRLKEAENFCLQALEMQQRLFQGDHPSVADGLNNLGGLYNEQERLEEAENLYLQALEMYQRLFGNNHLDVVRSLNNLALLYNKQGRLKEVENFCLQALGIQQRLFQGDHPDVALSLNNLAVLYLWQEQLEEAELLCLQALKMRQRLFQDDHPDVAQSIHNVGVLYCKQGRWEEAEPLLVQALAIHKQVLGINHPNTVRTQNWLEKVYQAIQDTRRSRQRVPWLLRMMGRG